jgi:hypothetical protein
MRLQSRNVTDSLMVWMHNTRETLSSIAQQNRPFLDEMPVAVPCSPSLAKAIRQAS